MIEFPPPRPGEPVRVSATLFVTWRRCPMQAGARLQGIYPPETVRTFTGALCHRLFARHLRTGPIPPELIPQVCREEIGAALNPKMAAAGVASPGRLRPVIEEAERIYRRFTTLTADGFEAAEVDLEVVPADGVTMVGRVDAVFRPGDGVVLVDWKTGELGDDVDIQLGFYALLWALDRGELPAAVEAVSVRTGERIRRRPTVGDLTDMARDVSAMAGTLREIWESGGSPSVRPGPWCVHCPVLRDCAEGSAAVRLLSGP